MDLFLSHLLGLLWVSVGTARQLTARTADQLLAAALLAWGNIVATSLLLSVLHHLGEPWWFLGTSGLLAVLTSLLALKVRPEILPVPVGSNASPWLVGAFIFTLAPLALGSLGIACTYRPGHPDALAWQLPRAMYYLGQNSLAHFDASDPRQVYLPFNYNLLQLFGLIYDPPGQCLNLFNLIAWSVSGIATYRLCRLCAFGANASLITSWLVLTATPVLAQATSTTGELPAGTALLCALVFALRWKQTNAARDALLTGLGVGLAAGSSLGVVAIGALAALVSLGRTWRLGNFARNAASARMWIVPALLAFMVGAPFALINLPAKERWPATEFQFAANNLPERMAQVIGTGFLPLPSQPPALHILNEDVVGFGFTGLVFLLGAVFCAARYRQPIGAARWFAGLGLGWIILNFLLPRWWSAGLRDFVPALMVLSPCAAALVEAGLEGLRPWRLVGFLICLVVALAAGWSAGVYLLRNSSRPLLPVLNAAFAPPALPALPLLVEHHLSHQPRINVDTDAHDERIFPLMTVGHNQRFTSWERIVPESYNILSRSSLSRNAAFLNLTSLPSYRLLPLPTKRTAGVEFLATIGGDAAARDYFGVEPHAGNTPSISTNRTVLITFSRLSRPSVSQERIKVNVAGLNPQDNTRLTVEAESFNREIPNSRLAIFTADGESVVSLAKPFLRLTLKAADATSGEDIGTASIPYLAPDAELKPLDPEAPTNAGSFFVTDVVLARSPSAISVEGLLPVEGPFPQWDLPALRWQRGPVARLKIPPTNHFSRLRLSFSVRLHVRKQAALDVFFNGVPVRHCRIDEPTIWRDETLELTPQPGENVVEFRDAPLNSEPDWMDYLERYPDVMKHLVSHGLPLAAGAQEHFETHGRAEGRTVRTLGKPEPAPDGYYFMYRNIRLEGFRGP